jgi:hypothetical protein
LLYGSSSSSLISSHPRRTAMELLLISHSRQQHIAVERCLLQLLLLLL